MIKGLVDNRNADLFEELRKLDDQLFSINEKLTNRWSKMKIDPQDISEDDYITIAEDYVSDMKNWAKSKTIH